MKHSSWVADITTFFEGFNRNNLPRVSFNRVRVHRAASSSNHQSSAESQQLVSRLGMTSWKLSAREGSVTSTESEHCVSAEKGRRIFDVIDSRSSTRKKRPILSKITSFDIFSGKAEDPDIPPIEAEVDEPGVYSRADLNEIPHNHHQRQSSRRKKSTTKPPLAAASSINGRSGLVSKKHTNFQSFSTEKDVEKENEGVIIRMRDQEHYYNGKTKYRSMLPQMPLSNDFVQTPNSAPYHNQNHNTVIGDVEDRSVPLTRATSGRGVRSNGNGDGSESCSRPSLCRQDASTPSAVMMQSSVLIREVSHPGEQQQLLLEKMALEEDDEELEHDEIGDDHDDIDRQLAAGHSTGHKTTTAFELEPSQPQLTESFTDAKTIEMISQGGPQRLRWAETEEGKKLIGIRHLEREVIKWQETQFELITSEASYYRSLQLLVERIYKSPLMAVSMPSLLPAVSQPGPGSAPILQQKQQQSRPHSPHSTLSRGGAGPSGDVGVSSGSGPTMTALQKHHLFSNILEIHIVSGELLKALESRWRENPFLEDLSDIFVDFCRTKLKPYVTYLRNQQYQTDTFNQLLTRSDFQAIVKQFESDPEFGMMNLSSLLLLPMQRPFRLKLLMVAVKNNTPAEYCTTGCDRAIHAIEQLIKDCTDGKVLMEQKEQLMRICNRLRFPANSGGGVGNLGSRPLIKEGALRMRTGWSATGGRRRNVHFYLFEDQLLITVPKTSRLSAAALCGSGNTDEAPGSGSGAAGGGSPNDEGNGAAGLKERSENVLVQCAREDVLFEVDPCCSGAEAPHARVHFRLSLPPVVTSSGGVGATKRRYLCQTDTAQDMQKWKEVLSVVLQNGDSFLNQYDFVEEAVVVRDLNPTSNEQLPLKEGQILHISRHLGDDEVIASTGGRQGRVPLSHVKIVMSPGSVKAA